MPWLWLPVGLLLGGALGNLADRAREGAVIDFIDPVAWPAFNVADAASSSACSCCCGWSRGGRNGRARADRGRRDAGLRLDAFLAARGAFASRAAAQRVIERGEVTVDGGARPKNHRVGEGERVAVDERRAEPAAAAPGTSGFEVVYEDEHLLVVDKPAGVVSHPAPGHHGATLGRGWPARRDRAGIVHRLDKDTSGLLLVARSEEAYAELQRMMKAREVAREYLALVEGHPDAESGTIDAPIGRDRGNRTVMSTRTDRARDGGHPFRGRGAAAAHRAAARAARDGPHPPDPRPPRRDRPSGRAGTPSTGAAQAAAGSAWSGSFCTLRR